MALVFPAAAAWLGWCLVVPIMIRGWAGWRALFSEPRPLFSRRNWPAAGLLAVIVGTAAVMYLPGFASAPPRLLWLALPVAIVNGVCEEGLWRGLYPAAFPGSPFLAIVYPSLGFAAWHLAPQMVLPDPGGPLAFAAMTLPLGLAYAWIAAWTGSVRWVAFAHALTGFWALGGAIASSLLSLMWP